MTGNSATSSSGQTVNSFNHVVFAANTANTEAYSVTVTAAAGSAGKTDQLTVMDSYGNIYHYRIRASAARELQGGGTTNQTCVAYSSNGWTATGDAASGTTATASGATVTIGAGASGTHTVKMSNADTAKTTGAHGAEYTLKVTVNKQAQALDAMTVLVGEDIVVDPSLFGGAAWSFAKSTATATASVPSASGAAGTGVTIHGVKEGSTTVTFETADTVYTVPVTVQEKPAVNLDSRYVYVGEDVVVPASFFGGKAWKNAVSATPSTASIPAASGEAGTGVTIHGLVKTDSTHPVLVTFETADTKYNVHVYVQEKKAVDLGTVQVRVGQDLAIVNSNVKGSWSNPVSATPGKVTVTSGATGGAGTGPTVHGVAVTDATGVAVTFSDATALYTVHVQVVDKLQYDGGIKTVVPPPQAGHGFESFEAPGIIPVDPAWGSNYTINIADGNVATYEQTEAGIVVHGIPQGLRGDVGGTQDNGAKTTLTVTTDEAVWTYTIYVVSDETHVVQFCQGDKTQIWYNDTTGSETWFLLINDQRFELGQRGAGEQMHVTLTAQDDQISYIIATADRVGDPEHGDLVVISDGSKYYTYRMSCSPERVVAVGESTNMVCRTVAVNPWRVDYMSDQWGYTNYIDVVCDHNTDETKSHFTTATIAGRAIAGETYVLVRDDQHKADEHNAQGAVYTLKTRVVGAPEIPVQISPGVSADVSWENWVDPEATLTIEIEGDAAGVYSAQFVEGHDHGDGFVMTLSAASTATSGQSATITVKAGGVALAKYLCSVMPPFAVKEGTVAPGYLYGVDATPWVSRSSNPSVITVTPTKYNRMYSAEAKFLQEGWAELHSTNAYYQAGYYFIRATVFDTHVTDIDMKADSTTNVVVTHNGEFKGDWTCSVDTRDIVDVELEPNSDPLKVTAKITARPGVSGAVNVTVSSGYHQETIRVYVSPDDGREKVRVNGEITLIVGMEQNLPAEATAGGAWTATSMNTNLVTVTASGNAGEPATLFAENASAPGVDGSSSSQTTVVIENDSTVYIYNVSVVKPTTTSLDMGVINVGETRTMNNLSGLFEGEIQSITPLDGNLTLELNWDRANDRTTTKGKQEGETTIVVKTTTRTYYLHVKVRTAHIDKHIQLAFGEGNSQLTYSYTFDRLEGIDPGYLQYVNVTTNGNGSILYALKNGRYSVLCEGDKVTFIPSTMEITTDADEQANSIVFRGQVDGLPYVTELHYWVKIIKAADGEKVLQKGDQPGFISYKGTDDVHVDEATGDLILVFTNANEVGTFTVQAPWNVKMDILAVGGGGSGGSTVSRGMGGGGGGAGGFSLVSNRVFTAGTFGVKVGKGAINAGIMGGMGAQGFSGEPSAITNGFGYAMASAEGGGGGGAMASVPPNAINGQDGGSGGGAAWNNSGVGQAGASPSGQGFGGGTPTVQGAGGGGGGAGGAGGSTGAFGTRGAGRECDISGENVLYAVGGEGGHNDRQNTPGAAGAGPGYGGDGGSGAAGGAGADGVVIVRIKDIYRNIKVPIPGPETITTEGDEGTVITVETKMVTPRFVWTEWASNDMPCVAFEYEGKEFRSSTNSKPTRWDDAIESVTGTTSVKCRSVDNLVGEPEKVGVGYYSFTVRLKEGYAWEDGLGPDTYGDTSPKVYRWAIVESDDVTTASIDIHKTVEWSTPSNATVNVTTFTSPETSGGKTPRVLMLGTLCDGHGMDKDVVSASLKTITAAADVDYYLMGITNGGRTNQWYSGHFDKGVDGSEVESKINGFREEHAYHYALKQFYQILDENLSGDTFIDPKTGEPYDYIVFELDGSRIADSYSVYGREAQVSAALQSYYENGNVVWIVDNCDAGTREPWNNGTDKKPLYEYWRPNTYYYNGSNQNMDYANFRGLVGMFDPTNYQAAVEAGSLANLITGDRPFISTNYNSRTYYASPTRYENQATYDNVDAVTALLASVIKVKPFNLELRDKIKDGDSGLTIDTVSIIACTNSVDGKASTDPNDWTEIMKWHMDTSNMEWMDRDGKSGITGGSMMVYAESNVVEAVISNVDITVWTRVSIGIVDDGRFRTSEGAEYNQSTGKWEKNPNDGTAFAGMSDELGHGLNIEGEAETETPWTFSAYTIRSRATGGEIYVAGHNKRELEVGEDNTCSVVYRAYPGYRIKSVTVDGTAKSTDEFSYCYVFEGVRDNHEIVVEFEPYVTGVVSAPVTNVYDGLVHPYTVTPLFATNAVGEVIDHPEIEIRYALLDRADDESAWTNAVGFAEIYGTNLPQWVAGELTDVGDHEFAYRVYAKQAGYGESLTDEGWVWVPFSEQGTDHSVILPRKLTVRPNDSALIYSTNALPHIDFSFDGFLDGENLAVIGEEEITNGWWVTSTYTKGMGMGLYPTWVVGDAQTNALWNGSATYALTNNPTIVKAEGLYNFGNYFLVTGTNGQPVEKLPIAIGGVDQMPGLDPESEFVDTGVDPAVKFYDGVPTNLVIDVTSINPSNNQVMAEGVDYTITYALADPADPTHPTTPCTFEETQRLHAGTNVVWYFVEPAGLMTNVYFSASNYNYVVVDPRRIVLESATASWKFDGLEHSSSEVWEVTAESDGIAPGDTLATNTTASILHVESKENTIRYEITGSNYQPGDYIVETRPGTLTVTPRYMVIDEADYDPEHWDPNDPDVPRIGANSGVEDVTMVYDGTGTNITVKVTVPEDPMRFRITYTTNYADEVWSPVNPVFTNVIEQAVWFRVEAIGDWAKDYVAVTNYAFVTITPREAQVTANEATTSVNATVEPIYTATVTGDFAARDIGHEYELIHWDAISTTNFSECVKAVGTYAGVIVPTGVITQGNYAVTYRSGDLTVVEDPLIVSLWICDHVDAGSNRVYLAINPTLSVEKTTESLREFIAANAGNFYVSRATTAAELQTATPVQIPYRANANGTAGEQDIEKGWIWFTVPVPDNVNASGLLWRIFWKKAEE